MAGPATNSPASAAATADANAIETAVRGYDPRQVDDLIAQKDKQIARLAKQFADEQRQRALAVEQLNAAQKRLRDLAPRSRRAKRAAPEECFGFRAERLLCLAEQEAVDIRSQASCDAASLVERVRTEAEQHRHEVEQTLISRAALLDQQVAQRSAELQEREQQISDQVAAAREQADQLQADAVRTAERLKQESEAVAEHTRRRADREAERRLDQAAKEISRLNGLKSDVRAELDRLAQVLSAELSKGPTMQAHAQHAALSTATNGGSAAPR